MRITSRLSLIVCVLCCVFLYGCTVNIQTNRTNPDYDELSRVDIQQVKEDETYEEIESVTDLEELKWLGDALEFIDWEPPNVELKISRMEDLRSTLVFDDDEEIVYEIWFDMGEDGALIHRMGEEERYGTLEQEHAITVQDILLSN